MEESLTFTLDDLTIEDENTETFSAALVEMSSKFWNQIIEEYKKESQWKRIFTLLTQPIKASDKLNETKDNGIKF